MASWLEMQEELERLRRERDVFARLLDLGDLDDPETLLGEALRVAAHETGASKGYLAVFDVDHQLGDRPRWATTHGCSEPDRQRLEREFSRTIIDDTLVTRRVTVVPSAIGNPRYENQDSVRANAITSVVCAPIGGASTGILYLQGRTRGGVFTEKDERFVVQIGKHLAGWIDRILLRDGAATHDPTRRHRRGGRFSALVGSSSALALVLDAARNSVSLSLPLLITGAPGTGKSTLARELHHAGPRADGPFLHVSCAVHDPAAVCGDLLGGDADDDRGLFALADHGTLFLDDVDALPLEAQHALVVFLDTGRWRSSGGRPRASDVRVLAATSSDLQRACASGRFLRELHQRLHLVLRMPTLAERTDDVPVLLDALGRAAAAEHALPWPGVDEGACRYACAARWPRNVDDLKAAVERGLLATEGLRPLRADDLVLPAPEPSPMPSFVVGADGRVERWKDAVLAFKRGYATHALERHAWNIAGTAKALGVSRSRMFALLHELELRPSSGEGALSIDDDAEG